MSLDRSVGARGFGKSLHSQSFFSPPSSQSDYQTRNSIRGENSLREWRRKRASLFVLIFVCFSYFGGVLYHLRFLSGFTRSDRDLIQDFGIAVASSGGTLCSVTQFIAWYHTLPNAQRYGRILQINRIIVDNPHLFNIFFVVVSMTSLITQVFLWILIAQLIPEAQLHMDRVIILYGLTTKAIEDVFKVAIKSFRRHLERQPRDRKSVV